MDGAFQRFLALVKAEQTPGFPPFHGRNRYNGFTGKQVGSGATLDNGFLVLFKIGWIAVSWPRRLGGAPKTVSISHKAHGWYACVSCAAVLTQPSPATGRKTGTVLGMEAF